jgi:hypothetical protein
MATNLHPVGTLGLSDGIAIIGSAGPATVWTDGSDATSVVVPDAEGNHAVALMEHLPPTDGVVSVIAHVRASALPDPEAPPTSAFTAQFQVRPPDDLTGALAQGIGIDGFPNDGTIHDFAVVSDPIDDPVAIAAALAGDVYLDVYASFQFLTVYEAWLEVVSLSPCYQTLGITYASDSVPPDGIVGSPATVWNDGDDATHVTLDGSGGNVVNVRAPIAPYSGRTALDLSVTLRLSTTGTPSATTFIGIYAGAGDIANTHGLPDTGGATVDYSYTFTPDEFSASLADVAGMLADGSGILDIQDIGDCAVVIYEASVRVGHKCVVLAPPCHIYPRDDDQGVGTAAIWPPPSSQQATGQPGGYY